MSSFGSISSLDNASSVAVAMTPNFSDYTVNQATVAPGPLSNFQSVAGAPHQLQYTGVAALNAQLTYVATFLSSTDGGTVGFRLGKNGTLGNVGAVALNASYCQCTNDSNFMCTATGTCQVGLAQNDIISLSIQDESGYGPTLTNANYSLCASSL